MNREIIIELIDGRKIDEAFEQLDEQFGASNGTYNDLNKEYYSRPDNFNIDIFSSKLKRFVNHNFHNESPQYREVKSSKESKQSTKIHRFNDCKIYECNRSKQCKKFYGKRNTSKKVHAFFIHGEENHGHEQLFERFCNELNYRNISEHTNAKIQKFDIDTPVALSKYRFKEDLRVALFSKLVSENAHRDRGLPENIDEAYQMCNTIKKFTKQDIVAVKFNIHNPKHIHVIIAGVKYLINDICSASLLAQSAPQFYFFFSMKYSEQPTDGKKRFFAKIQRQKIKLILNLNWKIPVINELTWIRDDDIDEWLKSIKIQPEIRQEIIRDEFSPRRKKQGYYMRDLTSSFKKIIENYEKYAYAKS